MMKNKTILIMLGIMALLPLISAKTVDTAQQPFDMVYLLVENVFGGWLMTAIGMIVLFIVLGMTAKMHPLTLIYFCIMFIITFSIGLVGGLAALVGGLLSTVYFFYGLLRALKVIPPE